MGGNKQWMPVLMAATVASCGDHRQAAQEQSFGYTPVAEAFRSHSQRPAMKPLAGASNAFDEDQGRGDARGELEGTTDTDSGAPYGCTDDCSGHEAGFGMGPRKRSFGRRRLRRQQRVLREGCEAFAEALESKVEETRGEEGDD